jgi:hypothetical protein
MAWKRVVKYSRNPAGASSSYWPTKRSIPPGDQQATMPSTSWRAKASK